MLSLIHIFKAETADTEYKKGVELTMTQLTESLKGINVTVIDAAAGTAFDPNFHNAVTVSSTHLIQVLGMGANLWLGDPKG